MWGWVQGLIAPVTTIIEGWQKRAQTKLDADIAIAQAKANANIKAMETAQQGDIAWENTSINNSGWKDEWFTIVLSIPAILCFVPGLAKYVQQGFAALVGTPEWYQWAFLVAVASSFGYKKIADFMALKKGV